ncbi:hypothetical protein PPACK8108_LOCUS4806 [Phakopsora pachyrhizi]|uniref:Uncharacterized protein n=1 Tax=Phakopsora pachyrhizi TaxID=170000 RepID=A0AAV0AMJ6_PHAPC|nr:hypothetical protein PPACK8108_LOCUS4806 [Phakopsora pachyrhizi]
MIGDSVAPELLIGRMDQLARKKEVLALGYKRIMEARAKPVRYWDSRMAHRLREPLVPGNIVLAYKRSLEDQWGKLFHNWWNGTYRVVKQARGKSYDPDVQEEEGVEEWSQVFEPEPGFSVWNRASGEVGPGWVIPGRGQNMTPGEILPGVQKSGQIFDSCPGRRTMQGVLDWIRAGLPEDTAWKGGRWQRYEEEAGKGCDRIFGGFCWTLQSFEEEGLGGGDHQGQGGWSKTTGATVL